MRRIIVLLVALLFAGAAGASDECAPTTSEPTATLDASAAGGPIYYLVYDCLQRDCGFFSLWVYQESNGWPGLQRGDEIVDDTCGAPLGSDTIVL